MDDKTRGALANLNDRIADVGACVETLQKLAKQHHEAIKDLQQNERDRTHVDAQL